MGCLSAAARFLSNYTCRESLGMQKANCSTVTANQSSSPAPKVYPHKRKSGLRSRRSSRRFNQALRLSFRFKWAGRTKPSSPTIDKSARYLPRRVIPMNTSTASAEWLEHGQSRDSPRAHETLAMIDPAIQYYTRFDPGTEIQKHLLACILAF